LQIGLLESYEPGLAEVLAGCVNGGAGVGFLRPLDVEAAAEFWRSALENPDALTLVARDGERIVGTVRLILARQPNGRHRAEVAKLLVHPDARGQGVAAALMAALDELARAHARTTLVLDTETGGQAEHLYERWGWNRVGEIPQYAVTADGVLASTTVMTKRLGG
jgi:GNAT superfamily N-acetyltransferase